MGACRFCARSVTCVAPGFRTVHVESVTTVILRAEVVSCGPGSVGCFTKHVLKFTTTHCMNSKSLLEVKERKEKRANREQVRESPRLAARARITRRLDADKHKMWMSRMWTSRMRTRKRVRTEEDEGEDEGEELELPPRRLRMR